MKTSHKFWDKLAEDYAKKPVDHPEAYQQTLERTRAHLKASDHIHEAGCGTGSSALQLNDVVAKITAADISGEMIRIAREKQRRNQAENIDFVTATLFDERFDNAQFDAVMAFNLFHLLDDIPGALSRARQMLKPGGLLISKTICLGDRSPFLRVPVFLMQLVGKAPHVEFVSNQTLEQMIRDAGFEIVETGEYPKKPPANFSVARKV